MDCPGCRKHAPADAVFCPHCGLGLAGTSLCPGCGVALAPWEHPCPHCGAGAENAEATAGVEADAAAGAASGPASSAPPQASSRQAFAGDPDDASDYEALIEAGRSADRRLLAGIGVAVLACAAAFYLMRDATSAPGPAPAAADVAPIVKSRLAPSSQAPAAPEDLRSAEAAHPKGDAVVTESPALAESSTVTDSSTSAGSSPEGEAASSANSTVPLESPAQALSPVPDESPAPKAAPLRAQALFPPPPQRAAAPPPRLASATEPATCKTRRTRTAAGGEAPMRKAEGSGPKSPPRTARVTPPPRPRIAIASPKSETPSSAKGVGWQVALQRRLAVCDRQPFVERTVCREKARWKYCSPSRWNKVAECGLTTQASN